MMHALVEIAYLAAIVLFILALYWMNDPKSARRSVSAGVAAMALAMAATWSRPEVVHHGGSSSRSSAGSWSAYRCRASR